MAVLIILGLASPQETVEPDGIEVLSLLSEQVMNYSRTNGPPHGRWRILPRSAKTEGEWRHPPALFPPQLHSGKCIIFFLNRQRHSEWERVWMARRMNEWGKIRLKRRQMKNKYRSTCFGFINSISAPTKGIVTLHFQNCLKLHDTWYMMLNLPNYGVQPLPPFSSGSWNQLICYNIRVMVFLWWQSLLRDMITLW